MPRHTTKPSRAQRSTPPAPQEPNPSTSPRAKPLQGKIAVVAGASRGAGRGIAVALGEAGATVYVAARTTRGGPPPADGAPGTIEDTAAEISARGGVGIPVRTDCTVDADVAALFARVEREQGRVDVLACAVWGASDAFTSGADLMANWGKPFWELPTREWMDMMMAGPYAYYLAATHAARLMVKAGGGLIVGVTDLYVEGGGDLDAYSGQMMWELSHMCINRMMFMMGVEGKRRHIAAITLMPGFMRTERVERSVGGNEKLKKMFRYDLSETPEYLGRAVAALAADRRVARKVGKIWFVADLAKEYGFTDVDGRQIPRFAPSA